MVSISAFEAHSGSTSHHPSDNIYLENGKNLRDILSAGQESADCGDNILRALKHAIGEIQGIPKKEVSCGKCGKHDGGSFVSCKGAKCSSAYHAGTLDLHPLFPAILVQESLDRLDILKIYCQQWLTWRMCFIRVCRTLQSSSRRLVLCQVREVTS